MSASPVRAFKQLSKAAITALLTPFARLDGTNQPFTGNITIDNGGLTNNQLNLNGSTHHALISSATDEFRIRNTSAGTNHFVLDSSGDISLRSNNSDYFLYDNANDAFGYIRHTDSAYEWYDFDDNLAAVSCGDIIASGLVTAPSLFATGETANTIAHFNTNKEVTSLPTATYPNLTELSYVKGVTSSIQDQIDNISVSPAGSDTEIQFNDSGSFGASSKLTWDDTAGSLNILHQFNSSANALYIRDNRVGSPTTESEVDHFKVRTQQNYCEMTLRTSEYDANATCSTNYYKGSGIGTNYAKWYAGTTALLIMGINSSNRPILQAGSSTIFTFSVGNSAGFVVGTGASAYITFQAGSIFGSGALTLYGTSATTGNTAGIYCPNGDSVQFKQAGVTRMELTSGGGVQMTNTQTLSNSFMKIASAYNVLSGALLEVDFGGAAGRSALFTDNSFNDGSLRIEKATSAAPSNSQVSTVYALATYTHSDAGAGDGIGKGMRVEASNNTATSGALMGLDVKATANQSGATSIGARIRSSSSSGSAIVARLEHDVSNYLDIKVDSSGNPTYDATGSRHIFSERINIPTHTPSSASDTGTTGDIAWDADYLYICTGTNAWKRAAITTW